MAQNDINAFAGDFNDGGDGDWANADPIDNVAPVAMAGQEDDPFGGAVQQPAEASNFGMAQPAANKDDNEQYTDEELQILANATARQEEMKRELYEKM